MIDDKLRDEAWQVFKNNYSGQTYWLQIDFSQWLKNDHSTVCARQANKHEDRCNVPCTYCISRMLAKQVSK